MQSVLFVQPFCTLIFAKLSVTVNSGVASAVQSLFPAVPSPNFTPDCNQGTGMGTNDSSDWSSIYYSASQPLTKAIEWVCELNYRLPTASVAI